MCTLSVQILRFIHATCLYSPRATDSTAAGCHAVFTLGLLQTLSALQPLITADCQRARTGCVVSNASLQTKSRHDRNSSDQYLSGQYTTTYASFRSARVVMACMTMSSVAPGNTVDTISTSSWLSSFGTSTPSRRPAAQPTDTSVTCSAGPPRSPVLFSLSMPV